MLRLSSILIPASLILAAAPAGAAMTVHQFVTRANDLRAQGIAAVISPDFAVLKEEARQAKVQLQAENARRLAARKAPIACVPEGETIGIEEMLDGRAALPAAYHARPLKDGYARVIAQRFPCR